jgi:hypothetical protein
MGSKKGECCIVQSLLVADVQNSSKTVRLTEQVCGLAAERALRGLERPQAAGHQLLKQIDALVQHLQAVIDGADPVQDLIEDCVAHRHLLDCIDGWVAAARRPGNANSPRGGVTSGAVAVPVAWGGAVRNSALPGTRWAQLVRPDRSYQCGIT